MAELYWPRSTTFLGRDQQYAGPEVHDVPDELEEKFRARGWEDPPEEGNESEDVEESDEDYQTLDPSEYTVAELENELETGDFDATLDEIEEAEKAQKDRDGALEAIANRREQLEE
ncbi:hypothetical protein HTZ84_05165 [Haloterrigena sp. SYSU A558-1]|uniref:Uncharacterized protein n=1 Tax=Haloterrigena gelatinilytica TaxID=2741724 RepID=A0ABX2LBI9_9EURY|nr:hypothetical protein [Haloterrigena gelatinilytica]NUC71703.1 hypothetical protein [Haloterrigena gelatinilytica]